MNKKYLDEKDAIITKYKNMLAKNREELVNSRKVALSVIQDIEFQKSHLKEALKKIKKSKKELLKAKEEAEALHRAKSMFLANISHEIRTPMNAILGYCKLIQQTKLDSIQKEYFDIITQNGENLLGIINNILNMSEIEAEHIKINVSSFNFYTLIEDIRKLFELQIKRKSILFEIYFSKEVPQYINADKRKVWQILINILGNAIKFTDKGSIQIHIHAQKEEPSENTLQNYCICVAIEDTGCGITKEDIEKVFLPFEQVGKAKHKKSGTGLGMSISRQYAEKMGGNISLESTPGQGSIFYFNFKATSQIIQKFPNISNTRKTSIAKNLKNLKQIPSNLLKEMRNAIELGDKKYLLELIKGIKKYDTVIAQHFYDLAKRYDYEALLSFFD